MQRQKSLAVILCGLLLGATFPTISATDAAATKSAVPKERACDRACLYKFLDQYLAALQDKDPGRLPWARTARTSENNVELMIGDGLWGTITKLGDYKLRFADPSTGQVGYFGAVEETGPLSPLALRLKIEDGKIVEAETSVRRKADEGNFMADPKFVVKPILNEIVPEAERQPRERLISIADGYFDTLQLNDGTLFTQFDDQCQRVENGVQTTHNPELAKLSFTLTLGCAEQFKLGNFLFDDRLRARRYPLVDVERGLVLAGTFIDHSGRLGTYKLTDGRVAESRYRRPHTYYLVELFKIRNNKIQQIEAVFMTVPYHMPSPWKYEE
jgi:hypothetical protein